MTKRELIQNQMWEVKYQMLQAFCGLSDQELRSFIADHWPIGWHVQHCMHVMDFMINMHLQGSYAIDHDQEYKKWPLAAPKASWEYPSNKELQRRWVCLVNGIIDALDGLADGDLDTASETAYNGEPLIESFLRILNHTHSHISAIWVLSASMRGRLPDQGLWMPRSDLFAEIGNELERSLSKVGNSQSPVVRRIARKYFLQISHHDTWTILENCEDLMSTKDTWLQMIANAWIERIQDRLQEYHFYHFERWLFLYIDGWGSCDDLCKRTLNPLLQKYPHLVSRVRTEWTKSNNPWVRRASAVSLIRSEKSRYVCDLSLTKITGIAEDLMDDKDKFVQKAVGWLLKAASLKHKDGVISFLKKNIERMPRLSFRYAIENLDIKDRTNLMGINRV